MGYYMVIVRKMDNVQPEPNAQRPEENKKTGNYSGRIVSKEDSNEINAEKISNKLNKLNKLSEPTCELPQMQQIDSSTPLTKKVEDNGLEQLVGIIEKSVASSLPKDKKLREDIKYCSSSDVNIDIVKSHGLKVVRTAKEIDEISKSFFTKLDSTVPIPSKSREMDLKVAAKWIAAQPKEAQPAFEDLVNHVKRVDFETFYSNFLSVVAYVNEKIEKEAAEGKYVILLVEPFKSNKWLAELALPFLKIPPLNVAALGKKGTAYFEELEKLGKEQAMTGKDSFPKSLVFFDDGVYSGKQMATFVKSVFESTERFNEIRKREGKEPIPIPNITVACPYMTEAGEKKILNTNEKWAKYLSLSPHEKIETLDKVLAKESCDVLSEIIWKNDPRKEDNTFKEDHLAGPYSRGNIWFDHKVPNYMSFVEAIEFGVVYDDSGRPTNGKFGKDHRGDFTFLHDTIHPQFNILPTDEPPYK